MANENITKDHFKQLEEMAKPLQQFLAENFNPHCKIEIDYDGATVYGGEIHVTTERAEKEGK